MGDILDAIVADYLTRNAGCDPCCGEDLEGFARMPEIGKAVHRAVLCLTLLNRRQPSPAASSARRVAQRQVGAAVAD